MANRLKVDIHVIDQSSFEMTDLMLFRGKLFNEWLEFWNRLSNSEKDPYTHPFWVLSYLKGLSCLPNKLEALNNNCLYFLFVKGSIVGVFLLRKKNISKVLKIGYILQCPMMLSSSSLAMLSEYYADVINTIFRTNLRAISKPWAICFSRIDNTNGILRASINKLVYKDYQRCFLETPHNFIEWEYKIHKSLKKNLRKWNKRADEIGTLHFYSIEKEPEIFSAFEQLVDLEMLGWKGNTPYALRKNDFSRHFLHSIIDGFSRLGNAAVFLLKLDDVLIAANLAIIIEETMFTIKIVYNEKFAGLSPGNLIYEKVFIEYLPTRNIRYFNCISTSEWFHDTWHGTYLDTSKMYVFPSSLWGSCIKAGMKVYHSLKGRLKT